MQRVRLDEAKEGLLGLVEAAIKGEEVIILKDDNHMVRLVPVEPQRRRARFGSARDMIVIADDFDAPLADLREYTS